MKKNNNDKSKKYENAKENNINDEEREELISQIGILDLSIFGICLIVYAAISNIKYLEWQKSKILDQLNNSDYSSLMQDLSEVPIKANMIYLFVTSIFFGVILNNYRIVSSKVGEERDEKEIRNSYKSIIAILLILLGTSINYEVLHFKGAVALKPLYTIYCFENKK